MRQILRRTNGFSLLEIMISLGLTGFIGLGAVSILNLTNKSEKKATLQGLIDREYAIASQMASNAELLRNNVNYNATVDTCLKKRSNSNCASQSFQQSYVNNGSLYFNTMFSVNGGPNCAVNCVVQRTMRFRWVCTAASCTGLETQILVQPLGDAARAYQPRSTTITLTGAQFTSRKQFDWTCEASGQNVVGIDYDDMSDQCRGYAYNNCSMPRTRYSGGADCMSAASSYCASGYTRMGITGYSACAPTGDWE